MSVGVVFGYTLFSSKVKNKFTGIFIKSNEFGCIQDKNDHWSVLSNFSIKISNLMSYFTGNNVEYLLEHFSHDEYIKLGGELYHLKMDPKSYPEYEQLRSVLKLTIELLYAYVKQYNNVRQLPDLLRQTEEQEKILNNITLLKERIGKLQKQVNLFDDSNISMPEVQVRFEMIVYMQRYGYPENGVFDTDKLQEIMDELNMTQ
jgi:hypothetical protein